MQRILCCTAAFTQNHDDTHEAWQNTIIIPAYWPLDPSIIAPMIGFHTPWKAVNCESENPSDGWLLRLPAEN